MPIQTKKRFPHSKLPMRRMRMASIVSGSSKRASVRMSMRKPNITCLRRFKKKVAMLQGQLNLAKGNDARSAR